METVLIVFLVVVIAWIAGFMKSLRNGAKMANQEVDYQVQQHEVSLMTRRAALKVDPEIAKKAKENIELLESLRL